METVIIDGLTLEMSEIEVAAKPTVTCADSVDEKLQSLTKHQRRVYQDVVDGWVQIYSTKRGYVWDESPYKIMQKTIQVLVDKGLLAPHYQGVLDRV